MTPEPTPFDPAENVKMLQFVTTYGLGEHPTSDRHVTAFRFLRDAVATDLRSSHADLSARLEALGHASRAPGADQEAPHAPVTTDPGEDIASPAPRDVVRRVLATWGIRRGLRGVVAQEIVEKLEQRHVQGGPAVGMRDSERVAASADPIDAPATRFESVTCPPAPDRQAHAHERRPSSSDLVEAVAEAILVQKRVVASTGTVATDTPACPATWRNVDSYARAALGVVRARMVVTEEDVGAAEAAYLNATEATRGVIDHDGLRAALADFVARRFK